MSDRMTFPDTVEEFMEKYKIVDTDGIYMSKGAELVPIFRMRQWFEHLQSAQPERKKGRWINSRCDEGHWIADCDQCGWPLQWYDDEPTPKFCCMCGADMSEQELEK